MTEEQPVAVYTVETTRRTFHLRGEMASWCVATFGDSRYWVWNKPKTWEGMGDWCMSSAFGNTEFYFKNEADATLFSLKWT
jgi:hypothetical protein